MLNIQKKREARRSALVEERLVQVETSIAKLGDEDLLDLADIFKEASDTPIAQYASAEMIRRAISL